MLQIDGQIVRGVAKAIGTNLGREKLAGLLADIDAHGTANRFDVFIHGQATHTILAIATGTNIVRRVDPFDRPLRAIQDPLPKMALLLAREWWTLLGHVVRFDLMPK